MSDSAGAVEIRRVRAGEWREAKALRLEALRDPVAGIAYLETHEGALARPDDEWRERTRAAAEGDDRLQVVAETAEGRWVGSATGFVEEPGTADFVERSVERRQVHIVAVYVHPDHRGQAVLTRLLAAIADWAGGRGIDR